MENDSDVVFEDVKACFAAMQRLAADLWVRAGHELSEWKRADIPVAGSYLRCPRCGDCTVVQGLQEQSPMKAGFAITSIAPSCGDRVYTWSGEALHLEVWL